MGGSINMAFRFSDGEACCFDRWTNNVKHNLAKPALLQGDEQVARDYIAMTRNNDWSLDAYAPGRPVRLSNGEYGIIAIDFQSNTIIDVNGYTTLFDRFSPRLMFQRNYDNDILEWDRPYSENFLTFVNSGFRIFRRDFDTKQITYYTGATEILPIVENDAIRDDWKITWGIDVENSGWVYHCGNDDDAGRRLALAKAREIGFPFTRKEGLNTDYPAPRSKKNTSRDEKVARYLFQKLKDLPQYSHVDGKPWEALSKVSQKSLLIQASVTSDDAFKNCRLQDLIEATTHKVVISADV